MRKLKAVPLVLNKRSSLAVTFEDAIRRRIVGQDDAIEKVTQAYEMYLAGFHEPRRPIANIMLLGPTGVGKTAFVEAVATALYGDPRAMLKVDCAEFQHSHEIAKLIGAAPGYLGYDEKRATLNQDALNQWHTDTTKISILLFDEVEKAHDALWMLLLGVMDKAELTLGSGKKVDFSKTMIFMTSNLGAAQMADMTEGSNLGFGARRTLMDDRHDSKVEKAATEAMKRKFSPEFVNRLDKVAVFKTLRPEHLAEILEIELGLVQQRILKAAGNNQFVFTVHPEVKDLILKEGFDPKYGARFLKRVIEQKLVFPMAQLVSAGLIRLGDFISCSLDESGKVQFTKEAEGALCQVLLEKYGTKAAAATTIPC